MSQLAPAWTLLMGVLLAAGGCAARPTRATGLSAARQSASVRAIQDEEEYSRGRAEYEALDVGDAARAALRTPLVRWLVGEMQSHMAEQRYEEGYERFQQALTLWDATEVVSLGGVRAHMTADEGRALEQVARAIEQAFQRRGAHEQVLVALAVERSLRPEDAGPLGRWQQVREWLLGQGAFVDGARQRLAEDLGAVIRVWPAEFAVEELAALYLAEGSDRGSRRRGLRGGKLDLSQLQRLQQDGLPIALKLAMLYLRVSKLDAAIGMLRQLESRSEGDPELRGLLERYASSQATPADAIELVKQVLRAQDIAVAQRVCRDATTRFPQAADPWLCVGELEEQQGHVQAALLAFDRARQRAPERREAWVEMARLYELRLFQLASDDGLEKLLAELGRVEAFHGQARERFPNEPLRPSLAGAFVEVGRGFFNSGKIDEALRYYERSLMVEPTVQAFEQMALIELKRGRSQEALMRYQRALEALPSSTPEPLRRYWQAKLNQAQAEAYAELGQDDTAKATRQRALADWELFLGAMRAGRGREQPALAEEAAEVELERGKLLYLLGRREEALGAFAQAIDAAPSRGASYVDLLAFLTPRGEREEALDAYHRALGRGEVSEYIKVYCSLWMLDLDRRAGEAEDPLARAFLEGLNSTKWQHQLARWMLGRLSDEALMARANTMAKRAEAIFYRAMRRVERGQLDEARALWREVLETRMMGLFEYDMAAHYLRHGAQIRGGARPWATVEEPAGGAPRAP